MSLYYTSWNLKCSLRMCCHWVVTETNSRIFPTSTVAYKLARFESVWLQRVANIAREGVQDTHHWSGVIDDATDEWLPQWRRDPSWPTPCSGAVSVHPDQWCAYFTSSLAIFPTCCNNWIQIWRIWRPQLWWDKFWSFFLYELNGSTCAMSISSFTR